MESIMTAEGHLFFSISCAVFAKKAHLTSTFVQGDWWHIIPSAFLTCLLPDIDHPKSFLGQRIQWISKPITSVFGHRGFTHSLLATLLLFIFFQSKFFENWMIPKDAVQGMILGYISHILGDIFTPAGVPLLWPCRWRFRLPILSLKKNNQSEKILCVAIFFYAILVPKNPIEKYEICYLSRIINLLRISVSSFYQFFS